MSRLLITFLSLYVLTFSSNARADETFAWTMPSAEEQLANDLTEIPIGKGAIFVPSITGPEYEPPASVVSGDEVFSVSMGKRMIVDPGPYVVVVSSGSPTQGISKSIEVVEGETTVVPVSWGALRIEVTDDHRIPHRGTYEIIRADTRQPVGSGFGADTLQGEILQTWLLAPGLYRIVRVGRSYRALRDYTTVFVPESGFVRYRLVQDRDTGDFMGGGVLLPEEFTSGGDHTSRWFKSLVMGFDGSVVTNQNVIGANNLTQYSGAAFIDSQVVFNNAPNHFGFLFQADEGFSQIRPQDAEEQPIVKSTDRLRSDALYTRAWRGSTGPYMRASAESQAFPSYILAIDDETIVVNDPDGVEIDRHNVAANETFLIADSWDKTLLREGVGMNTSFLQKNRSMNFNFRAGFGMRQNLYADALVLEDDDSTPETEYKTVPSFNEAGFESTIVATLRLPGWVVYSTDLELFVPVLTEGATVEQMLLEASWRNTLSLRLTRNLSLNYFANIDLEPQVVDTTQVEQSLVLRASWELF